MNSAADEFAYEDRYVAFLDVLGFKNLVESSVTDPAARATVSSSLIAFRQVLAAFNDDTVRYSQFSDSVLLSAPRSEVGMVYLLMACSSISTALLKRGVLIRGGIVAGLIYHQADLMFGPAIADAYSADRNGDPPRITMTADFVADGRATGLFQTKWPAVVLQDEYDGQFILNTVLHASTARPGLDQLLGVLDGYAIVERINHFCNERNHDRSVVAKWRWFKRLWNTAVEEGKFLPLA